MKLKSHESRYFLSNRFPLSSSGLFVDCHSCNQAGQIHLPWDANVMYLFILIVFKRELSLIETVVVSATLATGNAVNEHWKVYVFVCSPLVHPVHLWPAGSEVLVADSKGRLQTHVIPAWQSMLLMFVLLPHLDAWRGSNCTKACWIGLPRLFIILSFLCWYNDRRTAG